MGKRRISDCYLNKVHRFLIWMLHIDETISYETQPQWIIFLFFHGLLTVPFWAVFHRGNDDTF